MGRSIWHSEFFNKRDNLLFKIYQNFGYHFDGIAIPIIRKRLRLDTSSVIIDEARPHLTNHLSKRQQQQIGQNVNLLGEVVLGDHAADKRFHHYLEALSSPDINYISVKISGIYAQTHALNLNSSDSLSFSRTERFTPNHSERLFIWWTSPLRHLHFSQI